jgi:hypothetical protein
MIAKGFAIFRRKTLHEKAYASASGLGGGAEFG